MQANQILATDLDGTFIPLDGNEANRRDLVTLGIELDEHGIELIYVTGRHLEIVLEAIETEGLPSPMWLICDVGTSIYRRAARLQYHRVEKYADHLQRRSGTISEEILSQLLGFSGLRPQEDQKQSQFKRSYYCDAQDLESVATSVESLLRSAQASYHVIASVDPFNGNGLIDLLPDGVSKAYALSWWVSDRGTECESIMFAGDSGNDFAALTAGYHSIIVANADRQLARRVSQFHQTHRWHDRLFLATEPATSGVLQGVRHFRQRSLDDHCP